MGRWREDLGGRLRKDLEDLLGQELEDLEHRLEEGDLLIWLDTQMEHWM